MLCKIFAPVSLFCRPAWGRLAANEPRPAGRTQYDKSSRGGQLGPDTSVELNIDLVTGFPQKKSFRPFCSRATVLGDVMLFDSWLDQLLPSRKSWNRRENLTVLMSSALVTVAEQLVSPEPFAWDLPGRLSATMKSISLRCETVDS